MTAHPHSHPRYFKPFKDGFVKLFNINIMHIFLFNMIPRLFPLLTLNDFYSVVKKIILNGNNDTAYKLLHNRKKFVETHKIFSRFILWTLTGKSSTDHLLA
jgi:hypothetical protein